MDGDQDRETPPDPEQEGAPSDAPVEPAAETGDPLAKVRREAAGYRRRLRDVEQDRDRLAGSLQALQRAEVERIAAGGERALGDGADLWRAGLDLGDVLDPETGAVDAEKVAEARDAVLSEHPHWAPGATSFDGGARGPATTPAPDFAETLRRAAGGG